MLTKITGFPLLSQTADNDLLMVVHVSDDTTRRVTVATLLAGAVGNPDGGSAASGQFPVGNPDGGSAAGGQFPAGSIDGGVA